MALYKHKEVKGFLEEFKAFALKGNVIDLAVAVVIGTAFGKIVSSFVDTIIIPLTSILVGGINVSSLAIEVGEASVRYGFFMQSIIDFIIIAAAIFVVISMIRSLERKEETKSETDKIVEPTEEVKLLREIRDNLRK
ncbi:MAG: large conductance mechanosensitive channel protein MscL [Candidatus Paceibacterota bacterium]